MDRKDCVNDILQEVKKTNKAWTRAKVEEYFDEIIDRVGRQEDPSRANLGVIATEMLIEQGERATLARRAAYMDMMKFKKLKEFADKAPNPALALEAKLAGVNTQFDESRRGIDQLTVALRRTWTGGLDLDLRDAGLDKIFSSRALEKEWFRELFEINRQALGKPGITKNEDALKIAQIIHKWQTTMMDTQNREGAWIKTYSGYMNRTNHDPDLIRKASEQKFMRKGGEAADRDAWIADVLNGTTGIDVRRTFGTDDPAIVKGYLQEMWVKLKNGDHFDYGGVVDNEPYHPNIAAKVSAHRELHFKDADGWLAYNEKYGGANPTELVWDSFRTGARNTVLLKEFGTQPTMAFEKLIAHLKDKHKDTNEFQRIQKREPALRRLFDVVTGAADKPENRLAASIVAGVMAVERMAKLGKVAFSALAGDLWTKSAELSYNGVGFFERNASGITGYLKGAKGSEKRQVAELLLAGIDGRIGEMSARLEGGDWRFGKFHEMEQRFFRWTRLTAMTDNQRGDAERILARHFGTKKGKAFSEIGDDEVRIMRSFGITEHEWKALNGVEWTQAGGKTYLTPDIARKLTDQQVEAYARAAGILKGDAPVDSVPSLIPRTRDDLALKLTAYFSDRGRFAVLEPDAKTRAITLFGTNPGSPLNVTLRLLWQFKQFPAAMIQKVWGREVYGGRDSMGKMGAVTEAIIFSTLMGTLSGVLRDTIQGKDGLAPLQNNPGGALLKGFIRGGGGSFYGDYLLGEFSRHGNSISASMLGPTIGQVEDLAHILHNWKSGKTGGADLLRMAKNNTPFINLWFSEAALNYMVFYRIQEWMNPGYLERMERTMKTKSGTEFWLRPSDVSR